MSRGSEAERLVALAQEIGERVGSAMKDVIPPDAQRHLLRAQQELITALFLIYQHQAGGRRSQPARPVRRRVSPVRKARLTRIEVDDD